MRDPKDPNHVASATPAGASGPAVHQVYIPTTQVMPVMTDTGWPQMSIGETAMPATVGGPLMGASPVGPLDAPKIASASKVPVSVGAAFGGVGVVGVGAAYLASQSGNSSNESAAEPVRVATQVSTPTASSTTAERNESVAMAPVNPPRSAVSSPVDPAVKASPKPLVATEGQQHQGHGHHGHGHQGHGHHGHQPSVKEKFEAAHHGHGSHQVHHGHHSNHHGHHSHHHGHHSHHHDIYAPPSAPIGPGHEYDAWREHGQLSTGHPAYLAPAEVHSVDQHHDAHHMVFDSGHHVPHNHDDVHASAEVHHDTHHVDDFHASAHIGVHTDIVD